MGDGRSHAAQRRHALLQPDLPLQPLQFGQVLKKVDVSLRGMSLSAAVGPGELRHAHAQVFLLPAGSEDFDLLCWGIQRQASEFRQYLRQRPTHGGSRRAPQGQRGGRFNSSTRPPRPVVTSPPAMLSITFSLNACKFSSSPLAA